MTPEIEALARRAVACVEISRWPDWTPVEHDNGDRGVIQTDEDGRFIAYSLWECREHISDALPLLDTPAGIGCLLALVREAWPGWHVQVIAYADDTPAEVEVAKGYDAIPFMDDTEAEALVSALEAAP